jgi:hypothetical protein
VYGDRRSVSVAENGIFYNCDILTKLVAPLLSLALFAFFSLVGFSLLEVLGSRRSRLRNALLAPGAGAAAIVLPLFTLFRLNCPVRRFALAYAISLAVAAAVILWRRRAVLPLRQLKPFLIVFAVAFLMTGYPLFHYGFNWVSYVNDDMLTYVQSAHRFADHGLFELPDTRAVLEDRDNAANYWYWYAIEGARPGSDLLLAWVISLTGLTGPQIYMPVMLALHLGLISALGALVLRNRRFRLPAVVCCAWLAVSPLNTFGTVYQLMAQVFGLMLMIVVGTILLEPFRVATARQSIRFGLLAGLILAALVVVYFEIIPFLPAAFVAFHVLQLIRKRETVKSAIVALTTAALVIAVLLRTWALNAGVFLVWQATRSLGVENLDMSLFPFYLVPSGLANLWGLIPIGSTASATDLNWCIALGMVLLLAAMVGSAWQAWKGEPAAVFSVVMLAVSFRLFAGSGDYGLHKLAMYIQPFLLSSMVLAWFQFSRRVSANVAIKRLVQFVPIVLVAALGLRAQHIYVERSSGEGGNGLAEVPYASERGLLGELARLREKARRQILISDTYNSEMAKLETLYLNPASLRFPSADFFEYRAGLDKNSPMSQMTQRLSPSLTARALILAHERRAEIDGVGVFDMKTQGAGPRQNPFYHRNGSTSFADRDFDLLASSPAQSPLNHRRFRSLGLSSLQLIPAGSVSNHLILIASELGGSYYITVAFPHGKGQVSLSPSEPDYFFYGETMASVGRYLLFRVLHPTPGVRVVLDYTASLNGDGENRIPPIAAIGAERQLLPAHGRGSGRFFSSPIEPQMVDGQPYLMLDMGAEPFRFPSERSGLMTLFGKSVRMDRRNLTGFVREISVVSDEEYSAMMPPGSLQTFPDDLGDPNLEYSGIYEDGWVSEDARVVLQAPAGRSRLRLRGTVPRIGAGTMATSLALFIDGNQIATTNVDAGDFVVECPAAVESGKHRIEVRASTARRLPAPDTRPVAFLLRSLGFNELQATLNQPREAQRRLKK